MTRYRPDRLDFRLGPDAFVGELHRLREVADKALDHIDPAFVSCFGTAPAYMVGASDTPDREDAALHGEVGCGHTITSTRSPLPAWALDLINKLTG